MEFLIKYFENCVESSPSDIRARNIYKFEMFIAQYKAMRGLRKWCDSSNNILVLTDSNFPKLTEVEVDELMLSMERIIKMI